VSLRILRWIKSGSARQVHSSVQISTMCSADTFREQLKREKLRAERSNTPFVLLLLDVCTTSGGQENRLRGLEYLAAIVQERTRASDMQGWYHDDGKEWVGIILPDTARKGAMHVLEKIEVSFKRRLTEVHSCDGDSMWLVCKMYWYSGNHTSVDPNDSDPHTNEPQRNENRAGGSGQNKTDAHTPHQTAASPNTKSALCEASFGTTRQPSEIQILHPVKLHELTSRRIPGWKRTIDVMGASLGLLLFSPVMFLIAALIKITSRGPILFRQNRLGYMGRQFQFLKFRSMSSQADESLHRNHLKGLISNGNGSAKPMTKIHNDPRVTRLGKFLRAWCLDELPQLVNVLRGEMSLIGPRPPIGYEVEEYQNWHKKRLHIVPGITGLWQVSGKNALTFDEMVRVDLQYIRDLSFWSDIKILAKTIPTVLHIGIGTKSMASCREG
jgi:lipopolysaccharide/colanic/teichoic acid biosynthesis glycosyltransferase